MNRIEVLAKLIPAHRRSGTVAIPTDSYRKVAFVGAKGGGSQFCSSTQLGDEVSVWIQCIEGLSERDFSPENRWQVEEADRGRKLSVLDIVHSRHAHDVIGIGVIGIGEFKILQVRDTGAERAEISALGARKIGESEAAILGPVESPDLDLIPHVDPDLGEGIAIVSSPSDGAGRPV